MSRMPGKTNCSWMVASIVLDVQLICVRVFVFGRDSISAMYRDNNDTSVERLDWMLKYSLDAAMCKDVVFNGELQWRRSDVSPTCNCLRNVHREYIDSVVPRGIHLNVSTMTTKDSVLNKLWISNRVRIECFQNIRHTQVNGRRVCWMFFARARMIIHGPFVAG